MNEVAVEALRDGSWRTLQFRGVDAVQVAGGTDGECLTLTLIGIRSDEPNQIEPSILDIAPRHEVLLDGAVPRTDDGTALPVARREAPDR